MTTLIKIGNSQGIRISKSLIRQAHLENANLKLEILDNGLLIKPLHNFAREMWSENIEKTIAKHQEQKDEGVLEEFLNDNDLEDFQW